MPIVYRKTDRGRREIETRADRLALRLRSLLIMIDGQRSDDALRAAVPGDFASAAQALLDGGYIDVVSQTPAEAPPRARTPPPVAAPPPAREAPPAAAGVDRRRLAVRHLTDRLGPNAEVVSIRIEDARTPADLATALAQGESLLRRIVGAAAADDFRRRFIEPPPEG